MKMQTEIRTLSASDGHEFECFTLTPVDKILGNIVILQEIFGVTDQLKEIASDYASLGYQVAIPALFDRQAPRTVIPFDQGTRAKALMESVVPEQALMDVDAVVNALKSGSSKVVVMGFCWGGGLALRAAQNLPISGAIVFYGTRLSTYLDSPIKVPVLAHFGKADSTVPLVDVEKAQAYFPELEVHLYEAGHAFANHKRDLYNQGAAKLAHRRNDEFLRRVLA